MFDFAWSEIGLIAVVALVLIGPKDLPVAMKALADFIKKARRMAGEFQTHVDEMMREADLREVRQSINEIRNLDLRSTIERTIDPDRTIRNTFAQNPLQPDPVAPAATAVVASETIEAPAETPPSRPDAPESLPTWFVPTGEIVPPGAAPIMVKHFDPMPAPKAEEAPPFIPPATSSGTNA